MPRSVLVLAVGSRAGTAAGLRERLTSSTCHAPHLIDAEVGNTLRSEVLAGHSPRSPRQLGLRVEGCWWISATRTGSLAGAAWELRDNVTFYDALYVALAAVLDVPLLTADAGWPGRPACRVRWSWSLDPRRAPGAARRS